MQYLPGLDGLSARVTKKKSHPVQSVAPEQVYRIARMIADSGLRINPTTVRTIPTRYNPGDALEWARHAVATAAHESTFNAAAHNPGSTARGLMQILSGTQKAIEKMLSIPSAPDRIYEPAYAVLLSMAYLGYQARRYGAWNKAIHAYNQGSYPTGLSAGQAYLRKHTAFYNQYRPYFDTWEANYQRAKAAA